MLSTHAAAGLFQAIRMFIRSWSSRLALTVAVVVGPLPLVAVEPSPGDGAEPRQGATISLIEENDFLVLEDKHYTQGGSLVYLGADDAMPAGCLRWLKECPAPGMVVTRARLGFELGQQMYTPADLRTPTLIVDDRPYAGWLFGGVIVQRRGFTPERHIPVLESFRLQGGVIGPDALAEEAQGFFHNILNNRQALGWTNQLPNEPGIMLKYQRAWRMELSSSAEFIPHAGVSLGNPETSLRVGGKIRVGWHLPSDFGVQRMDSLAVSDGGRTGNEGSGAWGGYFFFGAEGRVVLYNEFLDGSLYRDSHHVNKNYFVADLELGAVLELGRFELALTGVYRSEEFHGQNGYDPFASFQLKYKF